jgi:hypothetical protein
VQTVDIHMSQATARSEFDRAFFTGMASAAALATFVGFAPSYYLRALDNLPELPRLVHLHGFLFTMWIVLLGMQTSPVVVKRTDLHRQLGGG